MTDRTSREPRADAGLRRPEIEARQAPGHPKDTTRPSAPDGCSEPRIKALLVPYFLGSCPESDEIEFEAHLLHCDPCYSDLQCLDHAQHLLEGRRGTAGSQRRLIRHRGG